MTNTPTKTPRRTGDATKRSVEFWLMSLTTDARRERQERREEVAAEPRPRSRRVSPQLVGYIVVTAFLLAYIIFLTTTIASGSGTTAALLAIGGGMLAGGLAGLFGSALGRRD